jgi:hypothetical protein
MYQLAASCLVSLLFVMSVIAAALAPGESLAQEEIMLCLTALVPGTVQWLCHLDFYCLRRAILLRLTTRTFTMSPKYCCARA